LHLTSLGKLFLATDSPQNVRDYAKRTGLPGKTPHSLTTLAALEKELDKVRRHGIAYDDEEAEIGLKCVAAPFMTMRATWWPPFRSLHRPIGMTLTGHVRSSRPRMLSHALSGTSHPKIKAA
jgi:hypothetical protein